jgi:dolichyl-phosphate-mannose--protein O-mannosyl transferase
MINYLIVNKFLFKLFVLIGKLFLVWMLVYFKTHIPHPNCHTSTKSRFSSIYELKYKREKVQLMRRNSIKLRMGQEGEVL